jgi:hypothetical protein
MSALSDFLARFDGCPQSAVRYVADLTLWLDWHRGRGTLPAAWQAHTPARIARELGTPLWWPVRPWRLDTPGVEVVTAEHDGERTVRYVTAAGELMARWSLGPDGDWWQMEYPVKSAADLPAARLLVEARTYTIEAELWQPDAADDTIAAIELPRAPYSDLLHTLLGWSDGLMLLLGDEREAILDLLAVLEAGYRGLVDDLARLPGALALAPDNLDGQFIPPTTFRQHMAESYHLTAEAMHAHGKRLIVHLGGVGRHLLPLLAAAGVDGIEGVAGPPQSDTPLDIAREKAGASVLLWGGIPQDYLLATQPETDFRAAVAEAVRLARLDGRVVLGVADRVPVDADLSRLRDLPAIIDAAW